MRDHAAAIFVWARQFISSLHAVMDQKLLEAYLKCLELHFLCMEVIAKEVEAAYGLVRS